MNDKSEKKLPPSMAESTVMRNGSESHRHTTERNVKLDILRTLAILECIVAHALMADHLDKVEYLWTILFMPDTAGVFFMASGALILCRSVRPGWRYVWHRISTFLPEFILFSVLYAFLNDAYGLVVGSLHASLIQKICYMFITPTWGPGWFILALISLYVVVPMLWMWLQTASRREVEIGIGIWLIATLVPTIEPQTPINIPGSIFGTMFNYGGYMLLGYYLVHWPFKERKGAFKFCFFLATVLIGLVFGFFLGRSGAKWGYMQQLTTGLSLNIVMMSLLQFGLVLIMPDRWFKGIVGRVGTWLSILSLGIYCVHWLVIQYWAIPGGVSWYVGTIVALAVSIPVAWIMRRIRLLATGRR